MQNRIAQFFLAELLVFAALFSGGLAGLGATMTLAGESRHSDAVSWMLVTGFGLIALSLGKLGATRIYRALRPAHQTALSARAEHTDY